MRARRHRSLAIKKPKDSFRILYVRWKDHAGQDGWVELSAVEGLVTEDFIVEQVGIELYVDGDALVLASGVTFGKVMNVIKILRREIVSQKVLGNIRYE